MIVTDGERRQGELVHEFAHEVGSQGLRNRKFTAVLAALVAAERGN
jgi:hypothetical protein